MPAANEERSKAYRLRDIKSRNRRALTDEEARWLARYDKAHPPRGPRRPAEQPGQPITDAGELGTLRVETIPTAPRAPQVDETASPDERFNTSESPAVASDEEFPEQPENEERPKNAPEPVEGIATPPPLAVTAPGPAVVAAPPAFGNLAIAGLLADLFGGQAKLIADDLGYEVDPAHLTKAVDAYRASTLNTLNRYWPDTAVSETGDLLACGVGTAVVLGGPQLREWIRKKKQPEAPPPPRVEHAQTPPERRTEATVPEAKADAVGSGY